MTLAQILQDYKNNTGASLETIAQQLGVNRSTVSRWISGETKKIQSSVAERLSFLIGQDIEALINDDYEEKYEKPILGTAKAGYGLFGEENHEGYEEVSRFDYFRGHYFLRVTGDSMEGARIHDQDLVFIKQCSDIQSGKIAVISIAGEEITIKRVIKKDELLILESANPSVPSRFYTWEEVEQLPVKIIGEVLYSKSIIT